MKIISVLALLFAFAGCAAFGSPPSAYKDMSADQIREIVKDKASSIVCTYGVYAGASITVTAVNTDKGIPAGVTVSEHCAIAVDQRVKDAPAK